MPLANRLEDKGENMAVKEVLLLGNPKLYQVCEPITRDELELLRPIVTNLRDTLLDFRKRYGAGRAIAAPQIGVMKRLVYMEIDKPKIFINPVITSKSKEMIQLWDDCMCFPDLLVYVSRHARCEIRFLDLEWKGHTMTLKDDLSELLQHECDHLDGILAISRAIDGRSFALKSQRKFLSSLKD
jgi:peptide deformylase